MLVPCPCLRPAPCTRGAEVHPPMLFAPRAGVLHTIIFNRALGYVKPRDVESDVFDISYVSERQWQWARLLRPALSQRHRLVANLGKRATCAALRAGRSNAETPRWTSAWRPSSRSFALS